MSEPRKPRFAAFDLVELTEPIPGHEAGARGTVIVAGADDHASVDFAWTDHREPEEHIAVDVPARSLRLIEHRRRQQVPRSQ